MNKKYFLYSACLAALLGSPVYAAGLNSTFPQGPLPMTGSEDVAMDTNLQGGASPQTAQYTSAQLAGFVRSQPGDAGFINALRGGDFGTNPFQRGASGTGITTVGTYTADGWALISGTATSAQWSQQTGASDIPSRYLGSLRVQRTSGQSGVLPVCVAQVLTSADSTRFQGRTAVFQFLAKSGADFSAASGNVTMTVAYGTGTNDTLANFLSGSWAGYTAVSSTQALSSSYIVSPETNSHSYYVSAAIPLTATQIGVKICDTPVGTAAANDWFEFTGAQLSINSQGLPISFDHRPAPIELLISQQYYWQTNETATARPYLGQALTAATSNIKIPFPVSMWKAPTLSYTAGGFSSTVAAGTAAAAQVCSSIATVAGSVTQNTATALCTATSGLVAGNATELIGTLTTGKISASSEL